MNTVRRIAKNTLVLFIAQIISMGLGFFIRRAAGINEMRGLGIGEKERSAGI